MVHAFFFSKSNAVCCFSRENALLVHWSHVYLAFAKESRLHIYIFYVFILHLNAPHAEDVQFIYYHSVLLEGPVQNLKILFMLLHSILEPKIQ